MPYKTNDDLPQPIKNALPSDAQSTYRTVFNSAFEQYKDDGKASATAWKVLKEVGWKKDTTGKWVKKDYKEFSKFSMNVPITKIDAEKRQVFGWANISHDWVAKGDGTFELSQVIDMQEDLVDSDDLESMAYKFTKMYREGGEMHIKKRAATMIESMVFTVEKQKALNIPEGLVPVGWWIGFEVTDDNAWDGVKKGTYKAFSIEGTAMREEVE